MKQYFSFEGRAKRQEYWATILIVILAALVGTMLAEGGQMVAALVAVVVLIAGLWVFLAVTAKRLRDAGLNVWWILTLFVPYISFVATIVFGFIASAPESEETS